VSRVLREVAEFAIRVEEQVLAPLVRHTVDDDLADLEPDDFTLDVQQLASGSQGMSGSSRTASVYAAGW
jgi:hypothetical protein